MGIGVDLSDTNVFRLKMVSAFIGGGYLVELKNVLFFEEMLTPRLVTVFYWLALVIDFVIGLGLMLHGGVYLLLGPVEIIIGMVFTRIFFELMILAFRIYEELKEINAKTEKHP